VRISKKAEYGLRAVVAIGRHGAARPVQIQDLSVRERIPVKFLEQILLTLKKGGLLQSKRGAGGGYLLAHPAAEISLGQIIGMIEGPLVSASCLDSGRPGHCGCGQALPCGLGHSLRLLQDGMARVLSQATVADILAHESPSAAVSFDI
jgi:Rrf2 family transcriptional regulator, iron-sulfur cluster assembly transcription factor